MRSTVLFLASILLLSCVAFGAKNPADYPLKVTVLDLPSWQTFYPNGFGVQFYRGNGHGNIYDGAAVHGFDFTYECGYRLERTIEGQAFRGKWAKPQSRLKLLTGVIGESNYRECELKTTLRAEVYVLKAGRVAPVSQEEYSKWQSEELREIKDTTAYPLSVRLLEGTWAYTTSTPGGRYQGNGRGNVYEGDTTRGFDFTYDCSSRISPGRVSYHAKWQKPESQLEVLVPAPGKPDQYRVCQIETALKDEPVPDTRVPVLVSQEQLRQRRIGASAVQGNGTVMSKLLVVSRPEGADIEVDGKFVGNTPSALSLPVGEHQVVVRKSGYKPWERKFQLANGNIRLNAELEADKTK